MQHCRILLQTSHTYVIKYYIKIKEVVHLEQITITEMLEDQNYVINLAFLKDLTFHALAVTDLLYSANPKISISIDVSPLIPFWQNTEPGLCESLEKTLLLMNIATFCIKYTRLGNTRHIVLESLISLDRFLFFDRYLVSWWFVCFFDRYLVSSKLNSLN